MDEKPTSDISVRIVELPVPILRNPKWMEITFPENTTEKAFIEIMGSYLETTEELARTTGTKQLKIPTDPSWSQLTTLGFSPAVFHMTTQPSTIGKIESKDYTIEKSSNLKEIRKLIREHFRYHAKYKPEYFTSEIPKSVSEFIKHAEITLAEDKASLLVASQGSTPIGFMYSESEDGYACIGEMFVIESERNKGVGTALLRKSAEFFQGTPCEKIGAYVGVDAPALGFYEKRGFKREFLNWIKNL